MKGKLAPVVLFVYNRPWHTKKTIEALKDNKLALETELYIYSDNAKDKNEQTNVGKVRGYIDTINGFKKVTIIKKSKNWGLAASIIDGVSNLVNKHGRIIVIEDDLVTSPCFLNFMNDALDFYNDDDKVMHVSGYVYPIDNNGLDDTYFIKPASCWGWATWDKSWKYYKKDAQYYLDVFDKDMIRDFNLDGSYKYFDQIKQNKAGKINTWAIFWYASIYLRGGLSLHPKNSFVKNIGHDGAGENCVESSYYDVEISENYPVIFTHTIAENINARKSFERFFDNIKEPLLKRIINKGSRMIFGKNLLKLKKG